MVSSLQDVVMLVASALGSGMVGGEEPTPTVEQVRELLQKSDPRNSGYPQLVKFGAKALPAYGIILADPKANPLELAAVMGLVSDIKADRKKFPDLAVALFAHEEPIVRREAIRLLAEIGTERDTPPILAMLSDEDATVRKAAATTLSRIGGKRDLVAMDIWLKTGNYRNDVFHLNYVKECRDKLEKRLKETPKDKKP